MKNIVVLLACMMLSISGAYAKGVSEIESDLEVPTLTKLHQENPTQFPRPSSYDLRKVLAAGTNTITKYLKDSNGDLTEVYYEVVVNKTAGDLPALSAYNYYYKWEDTLIGRQLVPATDESDAEIIVYLIDEATTRITANPHEAPITGNFAKLGTGVQLGGAIYSTNPTGDITGTFVGNHASSPGSSALGGAIYSTGTIGDIKGDFIGNYVASGSSGYGGAIYSTRAIGDIIGNFIGNCINSVSSTNTYAFGGAIYNSSTGSIGSITGDFIGNYANSSTSAVAGSYGGAIDNRGIIVGGITGDFIGNYAESSGSYPNAFGGAIYNSSTGSIGSIAGDFIGNYANAAASYGGAIDNGGTIGDIKGDFIGNYISSSGTAYGGAVHNTRTIGDITGSFMDNYVESTGIAYGGAIYSTGTISDIKGDFINNSAKSTTSVAYGGAISNNWGAMGDIIGDFIGNYVVSISDYARGGAIYNIGTINSITGNFVENYAKSTVDRQATGGAINNAGAINNINGDFIRNYAKSTVGFGDAIGGAMYNTGTIGNITGNFTGNYAESVNGEASGGAIHNYTSASMGNITGNFTGNYIKSTDGAMSLYGGAIANWGTIGDITGDFIGNYATSADSYVYGGAIHNEGTIGNITDSSFINNRAQTNSDTAQGGAIYSTKTINLVARNKDVLFSGNYVSTDSGVTKVSNAIHLEGNTTEANAPNLNLNTAPDKSIIFNDSITSTLDNNVININKPWTGNAKDPSINAPTDGTIVLNANMSGFGNTGSDNAVNFYNGTVKLGKNFNYFGVPINVIAGGNQLLDISNNNNLDKVKMDKFVLDNTLNVKMDVDLQNETSDTFEGTPGGSQKINLTGFNILTHTQSDTQTDLLIADSDAMGHITLDNSAKKVYTPIYKYDVSYNDANGILTFDGGRSGNHNDFNPSVLSPAIAAQTGALFTQMASYQHGFKTLETVAYMNSFKFNSMSKYNNKYASAQSRGMAYIPQEADRYEGTNVWYQPYAIFEKVKLRRGPEVSNIEYGSYFGGDSQLFDLKNGWQGMTGIYAGYNGSHQAYEGIGVYQNGGTLGLTGSVFKRNFFAGLTANAGALAGRANTMYGYDDFATLMAGTATKAGYNLHFKESKYILQPSMLAGYSFINTFDYTAASGVRIHSSPIHTITVAPEVRLIANLGNGWQPYLSVSGWWNIMGESRFKANDVALPELATRAYVQYGAGVQKLFTDNFSGFFQTMVRSCGRNGTALNGGLTYVLGKKTPSL